MCDILKNNPELEIKIQKTIRLLYPEQNFPTIFFPTIIEQVKTSLFHRIQEDDLTILLDQSTHLEQIIQKYCSLENLIDQDPNTFILIYFPTISSYVKRRYAYRFQENYEDIIQELMLVLMKGRLQKIWFNYTKTEKIVEFSSYFMVSVRYIIANIIRKMDSKYISLDQQQTGRLAADAPLDLMQESILQLETHRLNVILALYHNKRPKLELLLKLHFKLPISDENILKWSTELSDEDIKILKRDNLSFTRKQIFERINSVFNRVEEKERKPGALIRWIQVRINELITLMNKFHKMSVYDSRTFETLISLNYLKYDLNQKGKNDE